MGEFQEMGFRILAGSICILQNISINSCKSNKQQFRINSQSLLKVWVGGQDKPAGDGPHKPLAFDQILVHLFLLFVFNLTNKILFKPR